MISHRFLFKKTRQQKGKENPIITHYHSKVPKFLRSRLFENFFHIPQMVAFIDSLPEHYNFTHIIKPLEVKKGFRLKELYSEKIPKTGPLVIVANHPHILIDQFSIGSMLEAVRPHSEIRIITDNVPEGFDDIYPFSQKVGKTPEEKTAFRDSVNTLLKHNGTIIVFPSATLTYRHFIHGGIMESRWRSGAIHFAKYANAPILPIHVTAKTSLIYNFCSNFFSRSVMQNLNFRQSLKKEMYIGLTVGDPIHSLDDLSPEDLRDIVYKLGDETCVISKKKQIH